jgi:hypothetical protein
LNVMMRLMDLNLWEREMEASASLLLE